MKLQHLFLIVAIALAMVPAASATTQPDWRQDIRLYGAASDPFQAQGFARIGEVSSQVSSDEYFGVRVFADIPDGHVVVIAIQKASSADASVWMDVGSATVEVGGALLSLRQTQSPASPAFPLDMLQRIRVSYNGETLLTGER